MRRIPLLLLLALTVGVFSVGCDSGNDEKGSVTVVGRVFDANGDLVPDAVIRVMPFDLLYETGPEGDFNFDLEIDSTMTLVITATKSGFGADSETVLAVAGKLVTVPDLTISKTNQAPEESGFAATISLLSQDASSIGVKESGSKEISTIVFHVTDSLGRPITVDKSVNVRFNLGQSPGGGEFIYPTTAATNNFGQVQTNLQAGTVAGVVQVTAQATVAGTVIRSLPVAVSIHGGLPDQDHFTIGPATYNFPGLRAFGLTDVIGVLVGDKYSNPVRPGTSVSFRSDYSVVEGSTTTDEEGRGSVNLISGNPTPPLGVVVVTGTTADEDLNQVSGKTPVVMSGFPRVILSPASAQLDQFYTMEVFDQNANPLVKGTSISVNVEGTLVKAVGSTNVTLDETSFADGGREVDLDGSPLTPVFDGSALGWEDVVTGYGSTRFQFGIIADEESRDSTSTATPEVSAITIVVSGPNGTLELVFGPGSGKTAAVSEGAVVETMPGDRLHAYIKEF
jgi:hypothetical protein